MIPRPSGHWFALTCALLLGAVVVSGALYFRSRAADLGRHARVVETLGVLRHVDELLTKQVLAARFGLLNQYDPLNQSEDELARAERELRERARAAVGDDADLIGAMDRLELAIAERRDSVERFKADNSVLKNSTYYLPTAAGDSGGAVAALSQAALVYNLVGDESTRRAYLRSLAELEGSRARLPPDDRERVQSLLVHAHVIRDKLPIVDAWMKRVLGGVVGERLDEVERLYHARFNALVASSNAYRRVLYGWSVLLAIAVGLASYQLRRLYADLERRVAQRTADLAKALDALWGEMKLARKIQEALVPVSPRLANCEVAAAMKPADEVGGDYYDVLVSGGREWILIGDVSGHGVPAGLVMMMCHTAVRTVLRGDPEVLPHQLLAQVNTVLTENIRQLGEDKYMSITALRRDLDGTVLFAGAHQDVLVYRAGTDCVEAFETQGIWLGLKERIADSLRTQSFHLAEGDVLVVHTDGITEAMCGGALFDNAGLRRVLSGARGKTAKQILDDTFRALEGFEVSDDATLLVVRQLEVRS
jgi:serine phosphatase RsbU (regulator of sigma subunit)